MPTTNTNSVFVAVWWSFNLIFQQNETDFVSTDLPPGFTNIARDYWTIQNQM